MITTALEEMRAALPAGGTLMGLDVGTRTIGVAYCDAGWTFATAAQVIRRKRWREDWEVLKAAVAARRTVGLVIGLPLNLDGSDSPRTQAVRAFARNLASLGLPVLLWDERWSTAAVERAMIAADVSRARRAERIDAHAAAHILQGAIDALTTTPPQV